MPSLSARLRTPGRESLPTLEAKNSNDGKKHCVFQPALMPPSELEAGTEWVARRFYSP
jgi:hypothetical protein